MTHARQSSPAHVLVAVVLAAAVPTVLAGCGSTPPADSVVYEVHRVPVTEQSPLVSDRPVITEYEVSRTVERTDAPVPGAVPAPPPTRRSVQDELEDEYARRTWIEANYGRRQAGETYYVPQQQPARERIIIVENEPRRWVPPITLGLGYWWGGHRGHHSSNWGWGLSTAIPIW